MPTPPSDRSALDAALAGQLSELFRRFEASLPSNTGAVLLVYTRDGATLEITGLATNDAVGHYLRVLDVARAFATERSRVGTTRVYEVPPSVKAKYPRINDDLVISRLDVAALADGQTEVLRVWNRGDLVGELVIRVGDGARVAAAFELVVDPHTVLETSSENLAEIYLAATRGVRDLAPFRALATELAAAAAEFGIAPSSARAIAALADEVERLRPLRDALGNCEKRCKSLERSLGETLVAVGFLGTEPSDLPPATPTDSLSVEWHTIGDYRASFDRRLGGSRFIILRAASAAGAGELVAEGLIDPSAGHGAAAMAFFDDNERLAAVPELASVTMTMLAHYEAMVIRLRAEGKQ